MPTKAGVRSVVHTSSLNWQDDLSSLSAAKWKWCQQSVSRSSSLLAEELKDFFFYFIKYVVHICGLYFHICRPPTSSRSVQSLVSLKVLIIHSWASFIPGIQDRLCIPIFPFYFDVFHFSTLLGSLFSSILRVGLNSGNCSECNICYWLISLL